MAIQGVPNIGAGRAALYNSLLKRPTTGKVPESRPKGIDPTSSDGITGAYCIDRCNDRCGFCCGGSNCVDKCGFCMCGSN